MVSITSLGPIIFLRLSEKTVGEYDAIISTRVQKVDDITSYHDVGYYIDYNATKELLASNEVEVNLSPRLQFCSTLATLNPSDGSDSS